MTVRERIERDSLGDITVPNEACYGAQTARALLNFPISGVSIAKLPHVLKSLAQVKIAAAYANTDAGRLSSEKRDAIISICQKIADGSYSDQFNIDVFQGGAGTSTNMNMNEVVANLASEVLGGPRGIDRIVHANDDVNASQSTNDAYATACRLSMPPASKDLQQAMQSLSAAFRKKADQGQDIMKLGRTQLQDAVTMTIGQEFHAFSSIILRDCKHLSEMDSRFFEVNLGGTALGSGIGANEVYLSTVIDHLSKVTGQPITRAADLYGASWDMGDFMSLSAALKRIAGSLSKIANDLRLLSSGPTGGIGEIILPALQPGSSLMPGKVNPVAAEALNQVCFFVYGLDASIGMAAEAGQLQLNAMEPLIVYNLHTAMSLLTQAIKTFEETCVEGIVFNVARCATNLENSSALATELVSKIGYDAAAKTVLKGKLVSNLTT